MVKPGSHEQHKHKDKINTKTKHDISSGTCKDKTSRYFLCFVFCSALGLCLDYNLMLMLITVLMSQTWLHSFVLRFVFSLCLCSRVNQALLSLNTTDVYPGQWWVDISVAQLFIMIFSLLVLLMRFKSFLSVCSKLGTTSCHIVRNFRSAVRHYTNCAYIFFSYTVITESYTTVH